jgi:hypothetical protein
VSKRIPIRTYRIRCTAAGTSARGEYSIGPIRGQGAAEMRAVANYLADWIGEAGVRHVPIAACPRLEDVQTEVLAVE